MWWWFVMQPRVTIDNHNNRKGCCSINEPKLGSQRGQNALTAQLPPDPSSPWLPICLNMDFSPANGIGSTFFWKSKKLFINNQKKKEAGSSSSYTNIPHQVHSPVHLATHLLTERLQWLCAEVPSPGSRELWVSVLLPETNQTAWWRHEQRQRAWFSWIKQPGVRLSALGLTSCVTSTKLLDPSESVSSCEKWK